MPSPHTCQVYVWAPCEPLCMKLFTPSVHRAFPIHYGVHRVPSFRVATQHTARPCACALLSEWSTRTACLCVCAVPPTNAEMPPERRGAIEAHTMLRSASSAVPSALEAYYNERGNAVATFTRSIAEPRADEATRRWLQGNPEMLQMVNLETRYENRFHPDVVGILNNLWWPRALRTWPAAHWDHDVRRAWTLPQPNHALMSLGLIKGTLEPDESWTRDEAENWVNEAWKSDTRGMGVLTRTLFCDALFQLCDMWTMSVDVEEYVTFLRRLYETVAKAPVFSNQGGWKPLDEIQTVITRAELAPPKTPQGLPSGLSRGQQQKQRPNLHERNTCLRCHHKRRAVVAIQRSVRRRHWLKPFQQQKRAVIKIQREVRWRACRNTLFRKKKALLLIQAAARRIEAMGKAMSLRMERAEKQPSSPTRPEPKIEQPSRYMLPKLRPPSRLLARLDEEPWPSLVGPPTLIRRGPFATQPRLETMTPWSSWVGPPSIIPRGCPSVVAQPRLTPSSSAPHLSRLELAAPSMDGVLRTPDWNLGAQVAHFAELQSHSMNTEQQKTDTLMSRAAHRTQQFAISPARTSVKTRELASRHTAERHLYYKVVRNQLYSASMVPG